MKKNDYLTICPIDLIQKEDDKFTGFIQPMNYSMWSQHDPLSLIIEGIHQFGVRITAIHYPSLHYQAGSRIPVQLKHVSIKSKADYQNHHIQGTCTQVNEFFLINFSVENYNFSPVIDGQLLIATTETKS